MKQCPKNTLQVGNQSGFVLVGALLIMVLLLIVGISATTNTSLELQIAGNDRVHKETFYQADGGTQLAIRLVEESLDAFAGFTALTDVGAYQTLTDPTNPNSTIVVFDTTIAANDQYGIRDHDSVSDAARDIAYFPNGFSVADPNAIPHTNLIFDGVTAAIPGFNLAMLQGAAPGSGAGGLGTKTTFNIYSQSLGSSSSESVIAVVWEHMNGLEISGRY
jgi:hypothetical protein